MAINPYVASAARRSGGLSSYGSTPEEAERSLLEKIGGVALGGLATVGNILDLPGSSVRDLLAGENPFDQWLTPTRSDNRISGREVLERTIGLRKNRETGFVPLADPGEFGRDVMGFGAEVLLDPLSYLTFGGSALATQSGKAAQKAGLMPFIKQAGKGRLSKSGKGHMGVREARTSMTLDDLLKSTPDVDRYRSQLSEVVGGDDALNALLASGEKIGHTVGVGLPFKRPSVGLNLGPLGAGYNRIADKLGIAAGKTAPARHLRALFDTSVKGQTSAVGQDVAERATTYVKPGRLRSQEEALLQGEARRPIQAEFDEMFAEHLTRPQHDPRLDPRDLDPIIGRMMAQETAVYKSDPIGQINRQLRRDNLGIVNAARRDVDPSTIKDFDILREQYNNATGRSLDEAEFYDLFRQSDPAPTRASVRGAAEDELLRQQLLGQGTVQHAFNQGDVVHASDRGNYGYVQEVGPRNSKVFFQNPETGAAQVVTLANDKLKRAFAGDTKQAEAYARQTTQKVLDDVVKATAETGDVDAAFRQFVGLNAPEELGQKIARHAEELKSSQNAMWDVVTEKGIKTTTLEDGNEGMLAHLARYVDRKVSEKATGQRLLPTSDDVTKGRTPEIRDLPEYVVNELHRNKRYRGENAARNIQEDFDEFLNPQYGVDETTFGFGRDPFMQPQDASKAVVGDTVQIGGRSYEVAQSNPGVVNFVDAAGNTQKVRIRKGQVGVRVPGKDAVSAVDRDVIEAAYRPLDAGKRDHAVALEKWLIGRGQRDLFTKNSLDNHLKYHRGTEMLSATADAIHDVLASKATTDGAVPLRDALELAGLDRDNAMAYFAKRHNVDPSTLFVDEDTVRAIKGVTNIVNDKQWGGHVGMFVDEAVKVWKKYVTVPFPGFAFRNHSSGQHLNLASGYVNGLGDLNDYRKSYMSMMRLQKTARENPDALTDIQRARLREINAYNVIHSQGFMDIDMMASQPKGFDQTTQVVPGAAFAVGDTMRQARTKVAENAWEGSVLGSKPVQKARVASEAILQTGTNVNTLVEWQNRTVMFDYLRNKGWSPEAAAAKVDELQFNYGDVTQFERDVMKRVFPFYSFSRKVLPLITRELTQKPGGGIAQTIRATRQGQDDKEILPEYVAQGTSVPWGEREDGTRSYLTGLGLAHEVPLQYLGGGPQRVGREALSMLNPLIKGPIEYASNRSFFMDRSLDDMDPVIGRLLTKAGVQEELPGGQAKHALNSKLLEMVASNSPVSRLATTARQLLDDRKTAGDKLLNLMTGARVTDITPAARDATMRDMIEEMMRKSGARSFQTTSFPKAVIEETAQDSPADAAKMEAFNEIRRLLQAKAKQRKRNR